MPKEAAMGIPRKCPVVWFWILIYGVLVQTLESFIYVIRTLVL